VKKTLVASLALICSLALAAPANAVPETGPGWGLDRIDQTQLPLDNSFTAHSTGAGVNVYVIDGGVDTTLPDFGGRASIVYDKFNTGNGTCAVDKGSHGTAVAGVVAGATYGVAKQANILAVNGVDCSGATDNGQNLLDAINFVIEHHRTHPGPAVANISRNNMGQGYISTFQPQAIALANAVNSLTASGVFVTVSAGNVGTSQPWITQWAGQTACANPPANAGGALVVAGSNRNDEFIWKEPLSDGNNWSSAYGECVDIVAPAQAVMTDSEKLNGQFEPDNGTSFAAPYAAGVAALYKATYGDAPSAGVKAWIKAHGVVGALTKVPNATPNLLLTTGGL
jgi:subtilisin family serine protease